MRGRIAVTPALVLSTRERGERDRLCSLYSLDFGKIPARFVGVERPAGKLKALSEPLVLGEYRLHVNDGAEYAVAAGGVLSTVFPRLRADLGLTVRGLEVCELLERLTPSWSPSPEKFALAAGCLAAMEAGPLSGAGWAVGAFALRLLRAAGFGVQDRKVSPRHQGLWEVLHEGDFETVLALPADPALQRRLDLFIRRSVEKLSHQPLRCPVVRERLAAC